MLDQVKNLQLPLDKLTDLFEQIIIELAELKEFDLARAMLRQTPAMATLKRSAPEKYLRLEHLLQKTYFDEREAYGGGGIGGATTSRERRRAEIAAALSVEVAVVAPSRLVTLIGQVRVLLRILVVLVRGGNSLEATVICVCFLSNGIISRHHLKPPTHTTPT